MWLGCDRVKHTAAGRSRLLTRLSSSLSRLDTRARLVSFATAAIAISILFYYLQYSTPSICCGDFDGYYHIKWSRLIWENLRQGTFPPAFTWLPLTTLDQNGYVDHHLLFHVLQIPFTWFFDLTVAAKVAAIVFASLALIFCYSLVLYQQVRYPLVWLLALLASSAPFLYRMSMAKAPALAIVFMVTGIYLLFQRRYIWLVPLSFLFVWTYSLFVTLIAAAIIWTVVLGWTERRLEWRPVVWSAAGTLAGFVLNPYFPRNVYLFIEHVAIKVRLTDFSTSVGTEWYPYESWYFLTSCLVAFVSMVAGYIGFDWTERKRAARPLFLLLFSTLLMIASFRSRRFVEYWPPFAVLFAAFSLKPILEGVRASLSKLPSDVLDELQPYLDRHERPEETQAERLSLWLQTEVAIIGFLAGVLFFALASQIEPLIAGGSESLLSGSSSFTLAWKISSVSALLIGLGFYIAYRGRGTANTVALACAVLLSLIMLLNVRETKRSIESDPAPDHYEGGMQWIQNNVPVGEMIFNTDWDDFPKMFFYDTSHTYVSGLDPTYLFNKNPELSKLYEEITLGKLDDPGPLIREKFGARYVFSDNETVHDDFYYYALRSGWLEKVYEDTDCTVLRIREQKGEPILEEEQETQPAGRLDESEQN